jgi:hypothetical protein
MITPRSVALAAITRRATELGLPDFHAEDAGSLADAVMARLSAAGFVGREGER